MRERERSLRDTLWELVQAVRSQTPAKPDHIAGIRQDFSLLKGYIIREEQGRSSGSLLNREGEEPTELGSFLEGFGEVIAIPGRNPTQLLIKTDDFSIDIAYGFENDSLTLDVEDAPEKPLHLERRMGDMRQGEADLIRYCLSQAIERAVEE